LWYYNTNIYGKSWCILLV